MVLRRDKSNHYRNAGCVLDLIVSESSDIFLQKFDVTSDVSISFLKDMIFLNMLVPYFSL